MVAINQRFNQEFIMRNITQTVYAFSELSDIAKAKALEGVYSIVEYPWYDENHTLLSAIRKTFKLEDFDWGYDLYTSHYHLKLSSDFKQGFNNKKLALYLEYMQKDNRAINGYDLTEFFIHSITDQFKTHGDIKRALDFAVSEILTGCQKDMEDYFSNDSLAEFVECNEYEFTLDGELV
jgi:hypothetical protein